MRLSRRPSAYAYLQVFFHTGQISDSNDQRIVGLNPPEAVPIRAERIGQHECIATIVLRATTTS